MKPTERFPELQKVIEALEIGDEYFWEPVRLVQPGAWTGHLATAFWLVKVAQPRMVVELGTHSGNSYSAFCQAISQLELPARAFAVDTWQGDEHAGLYDESVFQEFEAFNQNHFGRFSRLVRSTFDEARPHFADASIDILHIDGLHTYDAVKHDFETWKTAASRSAVVLFHDINVRRNEFGVWKLWRELSDTYPSFEFHHAEGLGILGLGSDQPPVLTRLFKVGRDSESAHAVRQLFASRGEAFLSRARCLALEHSLAVYSQRSDEFDHSHHRVARLESDLSAIQPELERLRQVEAASREQAESVRRIVNEAASDRTEAASFRAQMEDWRRGAHALESKVQGLHTDLVAAREELKSERLQAASLQSQLDISASLARQQSLTVQRNLLELQSARQEIESYKHELESCKHELESYKHELESYKQELENSRKFLGKEIEDQKLAIQELNRQLGDYKQWFESYRAAYEQSAKLIIPMRVRSAVPASLKSPLRAAKRAVRSMLRPSQ